MPSSIFSAAAPPLADLASAEGLWEQLGDVRVEKPPMGTRELFLANEVCWLINSFARPRNLGLAFTEMLFQLQVVSQHPCRRRPDVAFVRSAQVGDPVQSEDEAWDITPDLAIEIISPSNRAGEIEVKIREYLAAGVQAVWVLHPPTKTAYVHSRDGVVSVTADDAIDGGDVLPGFLLPMSDLFGTATNESAS